MQLLPATVQYSKCLKLLQATQQSQRKERERERKMKRASKMNVVSSATRPSAIGSDGSIGCEKIPPPPPPQSDHPSSPPPRHPNSRAAPSRRGSLKVQWPPTPTSTYLKALPSVIDGMNDLFQVSSPSSPETDNENGPISVATVLQYAVSLSQARVKMDGSITPGVVERRLSELRLLQSPRQPVQKEIGECSSEDQCKNGQVDIHENAPQSPTEDDGELNLPATSSKRLKVPLKRRKSSKLNTTWPPAMDSEKYRKLIHERKQQTCKAIRQAVSRQASGSIQERMTFFEKTSKNNEEASFADSMTCSTSSSSTLSPARSTSRDPSSRHGEIWMSPRIESLDEGQVCENQIFDVSPASAYHGTSLASEGNGHAVFADVVLPSGQRLPPPKGRKKHRRTNYRIRYQGPTRLRLEDVYGNLMNIPEVDDRFLPGNRDEAPLLKPRRGGDQAQRDTAPTCPARPQYDDDDDDDDDSYDEDEQSMSEDEVFAGNRPDVWITPLNAMNGSRTWKLKRVWDVEDVDDEEPEYEVDQSDLMSSIRELLGVPEDLGATPEEWEVDIDETSPWDNAGDKDSPLAPPRRPAFYVKTVYDVEGQLDGSEPSITLNELDFENQIQHIAESTDHNMVPEYTLEEAVEEAGSVQEITEHEFEAPSVPNQAREESVKKAPEPVAPLGSPDLSSPRAFRRPGEKHPRRVKSKTKLGSWKYTSASPNICIQMNISNHTPDAARENKTRGTPTWQKQASGSPKQKEPIKMWWH